MKKLIALLSILFVLMPAGVFAQGLTQQKLGFAPGRSQATISGEISGRQTIDYVVSAKRGQTISISFAPSNRFAFFNLLAPVTGDALFVGQDQGNPAKFTARLGTTGNYVVRVYLIRAAARRGETSDYSLTVAISGGTPSPPPVAGDESAGLDFWAVSGLTPGDKLNMRRGPSRTERVVATFRNGAVLANLGCRRIDDQRWCKVRNPDFPAQAGWVNGRYLRESGAPVDEEQPIKTPPPSDDFADGEAGGPDFWTVSGLTPGDRLNVRRGPSRAERVVATFRNGAVLANLGCRRIDAQRWCKVQNPDFANQTGWANGRYLREAAAPVDDSRPDDVIVPRPDTQATGDLDCAITGYPSVRSCEFGVTRSGRDRATVSITLPDGDQRVLEFDNGDVRSLSGVSAFRFRQSGDTYFINVNNGQERFTMFDTVINGG